jgi:hypothetical protein
MTPRWGHEAMQDADKGFHQINACKQWLFLKVARRARGGIRFSKLSSCLVPESRLDYQLAIFSISRRISPSTKQGQVNEGSACNFVGGS